MPKDQTNLHESVAFIGIDHVDHGKTTLVDAVAARRSEPERKPTREATVFISYRHEDRRWNELIKELFDALQRGMEVYGRRLPRIFSGSDREDIVQDALLRLLKRTTQDRASRIHVLHFAGHGTSSPRESAFDRLSEADLRPYVGKVLHNESVLMLKRSARITGLQRIVPERIRELDEYEPLGGVFWLEEERSRGRIGDAECSDRPLRTLIKTSHEHIRVPPREFLVNRVLSLSEKQVEKQHEGLRRLGGTVASVAKVWSLVQRWWALAPTEEGVRIGLTGSRDKSLYKVMEAMASDLRVDIHLEPDAAIDACLIKTKHSRSIFLNSGLGFRERAFYVAHELAHELLRHKEANHLLVDASSEQLEGHLHQEQEADAFAAVMLHVASGLLDIWEPAGADGETEELPVSHVERCAERQATTA